MLKNRYYICMIIVCGMIMAAITGAAVRNSRERLVLQQKLASELIRFHVRANSDSEEDQQLKLAVRDAVIDYLAPLLAGSDSIDNSRRIITQNIGGITVTARNVIRRQGFEYDVKAYFEQSYFPVRAYGDITLPNGEYEAFRVDIGNAAGHNWWCVLYPPLCFEDVSHAVMTESAKTSLREALTEEEYSAISQGDDSSDIKVEFKLLKFLNRYISKNEN